MKFKLYLFSVLFAAIPLIACGCSNKNMAVENTGIKLHDNFKDFDSGIIRKILPLKDFHGINVASYAKVYYTQGSEYKVVFEGRESVWKGLSFDVHGGILVVGFSKDTCINSFNSSSCNLYITAPNIDQLHTSGFLTFYAKSLKTHILAVCNNGNMDLFIDKLKADSYSIINNGFMTNNGIFEVGRFEMQNFAAYSSKSDLKASEDMNLSNGGSVYINGGIDARNIYWKSSSADYCEMDINAENVDFNIAGSGVINGKFKGDGISIKCDGAAKVNMDVDCSSVTAGVNGSGSITLSGTADKTDIYGKGVSRVDTSRLNNFD